jgi:hypothetical protein
LFRNEKDAFRGLRGHLGMVRCLGDYELNEFSRFQGDFESSPSVSQKMRAQTTSNLLLEWGEHDLADLFTDEHPPVLETEIEVFWAELFEVANAVEGIHNLRDITNQEYHGQVTYVSHLSSRLLIALGGTPTSSQIIFYALEGSTNWPTQAVLSLWSKRMKCLKNLFLVERKRMVRSTSRLLRLRSQTQIADCLC